MNKANHPTPDLRCDAVKNMLVSLVDKLSLD